MSGETSKEIKEFQEIFNKIMLKMDWNEDKTKRWFDTSNPLIGELSPFLFFIMRREKCIRWINALLDESTDVDVERL